MITGLRKYGLLFLIMATALPAVSQIDFGVRIGAARSSMTQKIDTEYRSGSSFGYSIAGLADIPFYRRFSFRPQVTIINQGGTFLSDWGPDGVATLKYSSDHYSLQIPLNVAFNIPITGVRMAVYAGPVPDIHLSGKMKVSGIREEPVPETEEKVKSFDMSINAGISVEYKNIFFSIDVLSGLMDRRIHKIEGESSVYQNNITFSLGYFFR